MNEIKRKFCNNNGGHISIEWTASGGCPLCASHKAIDDLTNALRAAVTSLATLSQANARSGFHDFSDVRGYANSRRRVAQEVLSRVEEEVYGEEEEDE